jgi:hypothetical protein
VVDGSVIFIMLASSEVDDHVMVSRLVSRCGRWSCNLTAIS